MILWILTCSTDRFNLFQLFSYTEPLFALLTFEGIRQWSKLNRTSSSLLFALSSATRSNGIVNAGFFVYDILLSSFSVSAIVESVGLVLVTMTGFLGVQWYSQLLMCPSRPWCSAFPPLSYSFIQGKYWNVGFLSYYTVNNTANFLLALPMFALSFLGIYSYIRLNAANLKAIMLNRNMLRKYQGDKSVHILPIFIMWAFMTMYCLLMMHVQVINRFMSSMPCVFWGLSYIYYAYRESKHASPYLFLSHLVSFATVLTVLFATFYPPA